MSSRSEGEDFLRLLMKHAPELQPQRYGNFEPLRLEFDSSNIERVLDSWKWPFLWKRARPYFAGGVWPAIGPQPKHASLDIYGHKGGVVIEHLRDLLHACSVRFNADFSYLHLLTPKEVMSGRESGTVIFTGANDSGPHLSISSKRLQKYIPDLYWGTILGPSYLQHFGRQRVLSSPAPLVQEIDENHVYIQLSDDLFDLERRPHEVEGIRRAVKAHLNSDSFFDSSRGCQYEYRVPDFFSGR